MNLLLDTHMFLWLITDDERLPPEVRAAVADPTNAVFLSVASVWEAAVKCALGKLPLPGPPATFLPEQRERHNIAPLPLDEGAVPHLAGLPPLHKDPFDRILIAQALQHDFTIATVDPEVRQYPVPVFPPR